MTSTISWVFSTSDLSTSIQNEEKRLERNRPKCKIILVWMMDAWYFLLYILLYFSQLRNTLLIIGEKT